MTRDDVTNQVQRQLDDLNAGFFSVSQDINPAIQDGYDLFVSLCETIEKSVDVNFQDDLVYYDFTSLISDYLRIYGIFNQAINRWMIPVSQLDLHRDRFNWEITTGQPRWFIPLDWKTVGFYPTLPSYGGTQMTVVYKAKANTLGGSTVPTLPIENHQCLRSYACDDLLGQCEEFAKALDYFQLWNRNIEDIRRVIRNRLQPNQIYYKQDFRNAFGY